jgi:protein involved in polysaccharide export with SLBB domain
MTRRWAERWRLSVWLAGALALTAGCASAPRTPAALPVASEGPLFPAVVGVGDVVQVAYFQNHKGGQDPYRIGAGDSLRVHVSDYPELSREDVLVLPDGRISLNLIGPVAAAGRTVEEVAAEVAALYRARKIRRPEVVVSVNRGQERLRLFLESLGREQGIRRIEVRVFERGYLDFPLIPPVAVGRPMTEIRREIKEAYEREFGGDLQVTVNLASRVPPFVYVTGEVKKPGAIEGQPGQNLLAAVAAAGGFADTAQPEEVLVLRFRDDRSYEHWIFDLRERAFIDGQAAAEFRLQRGDVVHVSKSSIAQVNKFVEQYIRNNLPIVLGIGASFPIP